MAAVLLGPPVSDDEWSAFVKALDEMNRSPSFTTRPVLAQLVRGAFMPPATVRRQIAELRGRIRADAVNVVISDSAAVRHVQTALDWLHKPHYDSTVHATNEAAFAHVERALGVSAWGEPVSTLRRLVTSLERRAARRTLVEPPRASPKLPRGEGRSGGATSGEALKGSENVAVGPGRAQRAGAGRGARLGQRRRPKRASVRRQASLAATGW